MDSTKTSSKEKYHNTVSSFRLHHEVSLAVRFFYFKVDKVEGEEIKTQKFNAREIRRAFNFFLLFKSTSRKRV